MRTKYVLWEEISSPIALAIWPNLSTSSPIMARSWSCLTSISYKKSRNVSEKAYSLLILSSADVLVVGIGQVTEEDILLALLLSVGKSTLTISIDLALALLIFSLHALDGLEEWTSSLKIIRHECYQWRIFSVSFRPMDMKKIAEKERRDTSLMWANPEGSDSILVWTSLRSSIKLLRVANSLGKSRKEREWVDQRGGRTSVKLEELGIGISVCSFQQILPSIKFLLKIEQLVLNVARERRIE